MNTKIEIHENNTNESGTYKVWFKDLNGKTCCVTLSENETDSLLNMRQKHQFFMGQWKFKLDSEYDFKQLLEKVQIK